MKKFVKVLALVLAAVFCLEVTGNHAEAKEICFTGKYHKGDYVISLKQSSKKDSYEKGEKCGTMSLTTADGNSVMGGYSHGDIVFDGASVKKTGQNKYRVKDGAYKCTIKIKKKSISVKFSREKGYWKVGENGKYKKK